MTNYLSKMIILPAMALCVAAVGQAAGQYAWSNRSMVRNDVHTAVQQPVGTAAERFAWKPLGEAKPAGVSPKSEATASTVLYEDFRLMTAGEEGNPDMTNILDSNGYIYYDYVQTYGWAGINVYQAGGCCYLSDGYQALLNTPVLDLTADDGRFTVRVSFRAASGSTTFYVVAGSTSGMLGGGKTTATAEWKTVEVDMTCGVSQTIIQFAGDAPVYIDDVVITQVVEEEEPTSIDAPGNLSATDITGTSFTANWSAVTGATAYLLDVYYYTTGNEKVYALTDEEVTGTSYAVDGLEAGHIYFFTVQSTNGTLTSAESQQVLVKEASASVGTPTALDATEVTADGFRANWTEAENAAWYTLYAYSYRTMTEAGSYELENETFDCFDQGTTSNPLYNDIDVMLDGYTEHPNWEAVTTLACDGMIGLKNYYSVMGYYSALYSPIYYVSSPTPGKVTIRITAYCDADCSNNTLLGVGCIDAASEEGDGEWQDVTLSHEPQVYEFTFDTYEAYYLGIQFMDQNNADYGASGVVWIDGVEVSQQFAPGDLLCRMYSSDDVFGGTSFYVDTRDDDSDAYSYFVYAFTNGAEGTLNSDPSNEIMVGEISGIEDVEAAKADAGAAIRGTVGGIAVDLATGARIDVYTLQGSIAASIDGLAGSNSIAMPQGIYLVKTGGAVAKVIVK